MCFSKIFESNFLKCPSSNDYIFVEIAIVENISSKNRFISHVNCGKTTKYETKNVVQFNNFVENVQQVCVVVLNILKLEKNLLYNNRRVSRHIFGVN